MEDTKHTNPSEKKEVRDLTPQKDAKGGRGHHGRHRDPNDLKNKHR